MKLKLFVFTTLIVSSTIVMAGDAGKATYDSRCATCHASGVAGAPKLDDKAAWESRISAGMDAMVAIAMKGKGAMPPKGACADCSEADIKAAVEYMAAQAK